MRSQGRGASRRTARAAVVVLAMAAVSLGFPPSQVLAQTETPAVEATRSLDVTGAAGYDLDFTLPTAAKAGCMVCHGDTDLARLEDGVLKSYYLDPAIVDTSSHASVQCTGCHLNYAFTLPHVTAGTDWRATAKSACKNCHEDQFYLYGQGVHRNQLGPGGTSDPDATERPLCGDCHGSHGIPLLTDNSEAQAEMHADGWQICGRCHPEYWDNYNDYYHGAAYKQHAQDAPACWDCHRAHDIFSSDDPQSSLHERRIQETCASCHDDPASRYLDYVSLIHGRKAVTDTVPLYGLMQRIRAAILGLLDG